MSPPEMYPWGNVWWDLCDVGQNLVLTGWNRVKVPENLGAITVIFAH